MAGARLGRVAMMAKNWQVQTLAMQTHGECMYVRCWCGREFSGNTPHSCERAWKELDEHEHACADFQRQNGRDA